MWLLITAKLSTDWLQINLLLKIRLITVVPLGFLSQIIILDPLIWWILFALDLKANSDTFYLVSFRIHPDIDITTISFFFCGVPLPSLKNFLVLPCAFLPILITQGNKHNPHKQTHVCKVIMQSFIFLLYLLSLSLTFYLYWGPCICTYGRANCDNPVSWKCFINKLGSHCGWFLSEKYHILLLLTCMSSSVLEEAALCFWVGSHSPTLFNRYSLPS